MKQASGKIVCLALVALVIGANASEVTAIRIDTGRQLFNLTCATDGGLWWDPTIGKYRL